MGFLRTPNPRGTDLIGDILKIKDVHRKASQGVLGLLWPQIQVIEGRYAISVGGESGSGKSEIATVFAGLLQERKIKSTILQQDDYFVYPPKTNAEMRRKDIQRVGPVEVRLELLEQYIRDALDNKDEITKPLVIYKQNRISQDTLDLQGVKVIIAEGTYTTLLSNVHARVFIDRTYLDTRQARRERAREAPDPWIEEILAVEHCIISAHKNKADITVTCDYEVMRRVETK